MKRSTMYYIKEGIVILVMIVFSAICGFGIYSLCKDAILNQYKKSVQFNANSYIEILKQEKINNCQNAKEISTNPDSTVFEKFLYVGRFHFDNTQTPAENTISIKTSAEDSYLFFTLKDTECNFLLNNDFGIICLNDSLNEENELSDENLIFFSFKDEEEDNYFYLLFLSQTKFFEQKNEFGIKQCALFNTTNQTNFGESFPKTNLLEPTNEKGTLATNDNGFVFFNSFFKNDYQNICFVEQISNSDILQFLEQNESNLVVVCVSYIFIMILCFVMLVYFYVTNNSFLKTFKLNNSQEFYVLWTDEFGNIQKSSKSFSDMFEIKNIFGQENIDKNFVKLNPKDSIYLKVKDKKGDDILLNFLVNKVDLRYKLVGVVTRDLGKYFMDTFGLGFKYSTYDLFNKVKLIDDYKNTIEENFVSRIFGLVSVTNYEKISKENSKDDFEFVRIKIAQKLKDAFKTYGEVYSYNDYNDFVLYITNENNSQAFTNHCDEILKPLFDEIVLKNEKVIKPEIKAGFVVIDHTIEDLSFENILSISELTQNRAKESKKDNYFVYHEQQKHLYMTDVHFDFEKMLEDRLFYFVYEPIYSPAQNKYTMIDTNLKLRGQDYESMTEEEIVRWAKKDNRLKDLALWAFEKCLGTLTQIKNDLPDILFSIKIDSGLALSSDFFKDFKLLLDKIPNLKDLLNNNLVLKLIYLKNDVDLSALAEGLKRWTTLGIKIEVSDYGDSNNIVALSELFPITSFELSENLTDNLVNNVSNQIRIKILVNFAKKINAKCIASNITNKKQVEFLSSVGCDYLKGSLYSEPILKEPVLNLIKGK